jgi:hypothetical protein
MRVELNVPESVTEPRMWVKAEPTAKEMKKKMIEQMPSQGA